MRVVATAGHVDHGKSTLVHALTGMDPDRLREEKERGLTIDLGFAWTTLPSGRSLAFVDVPGHVRFLKNMLAGVGAVDACLFVVAATEGWKPQSEEHLRILDVLGVSHGMIAITKAALVDADTLDLVRLDVADRVRGTFLDGAEVVAVDVPAGQATDDLVATLDRLVAATPAAADRGRPRLWVDRVFPARGAGTVVTGTLAGGPLAVGDEVAVVPGRGRGRVRGLQSCQREHRRVDPGTRVAVNIAGIPHGDIRRGDAVVRPAEWHDANTVDASLRVLASLDHPVGRRGAYHVYFGSGEHPARLRVLQQATIDPGHDGAVRLHLDTALPLVMGDRFVLRERGRDETVGGGEVLDVEPVVPAARARPTPSVERVIAERQWVEPGDLERLTGERRPPTVGRWVVAPAALDETTARLRAAVVDAGPIGLDVATLDERDRAVLATLADLVVDGARARPAGSGDPLTDHPWLVALQSAPFSPPEPSGVERDELRELLRRGFVVENDGCYFAASAVDDAAAVVAALLVSSPEGVTVAQVRDALGTTRKHALPLLAALDGAGITRRRGDLRVAGPRLPASPAPPTTARGAGSG